MSHDASIVLTEQEEAICQLLDQTCDYIHTSRPHIAEIDSSQCSGDGSERCEARIAGGWVRDKLLARDSDDLDVSLSNLTGNAFALYLKHYLSSPSFAASALASSAYFQREQSEMGRIGKIAANPEQSKSLETATARVLGLSLDFVNLRKETYDPGSRIPKMQFGSPKEDAERRDITVNSLLYNVHTRQVEDHTGLGLSDLSAGLIRTPLPPLTTFLDDPLRVLRCVRFASRLNYDLHPTIVTCLTGRAGAVHDNREGEASELASSDDPRVSAGPQGIQAGREELHNALLSKVSRERFGMEVDKMLKGPNPLLALFLIHRLGLYSSIFHPPPSAGDLMVEAASDSDQQVGRPASDDIALNAARVLDAVLKHIPGSGSTARPMEIESLSIVDEQKSRSEISQLPSSPLPEAIFEALPKDLLEAWSRSALTIEEQRRLWFAVALLPLHGLLYEEKKKKFAWAGESVIANGLKMGTKTLKEPVAALNKSISLLSHGRRILFGNPHDVHGSVRTLEDMLQIPTGLSSRSQLAMLLRNANISNSTLQLRPESAILMAFIAESLSIWQACGHFNPESDTMQSCQDQVVALAREYAHFWGAIRNSHLNIRAEEKPLLDGNALTAVLCCHPRLIPTVQTFVLSWQFDRPPPSSSEENHQLVQDCCAWLKAEWEQGGIIPLDQRLPLPVKGKKKGGAVSATPTTINEDRRKRQKSE